MKYPLKEASGFDLIISKIVRNLPKKTILLLTLILLDYRKEKILPDSQFGFQRRHFTTHTIQWLTDKIVTALKNKEYSTAAFLNILQATFTIITDLTFTILLRYKILPNWMNICRLCRIKTFPSSSYSSECSSKSNHGAFPLYYLLFRPTNS